MRLFNSIVVFDVFVVAETEEDAHESVLALIRASEDPLAPSEHNVIETREARNIRTKWKDERPIVGGTVSDDDFETLKGKTTIQVFEMLNTKGAK